MQQKPTLILTTLLSCILISACSSINAPDGKQVLNNLTPYKPRIIQGNFISHEFSQVLQPGMSKQQVQALLGTPLLIDVFNQDNWHYVFTIKDKIYQNVNYQLNLAFKNDQLVNIDAGDLPTQHDATDIINPTRVKAKLVKTQLTDLELEKITSKNAAALSVTNDDDDDDFIPINPANYPPLESYE